MKRVERGPGVPIARHFSFEKISHFTRQYRDYDGLDVQTAHQTRRERISVALFGLSVSSSLCWILLPCSSTQPDSSQFCLGEGTCTVWSLRATWMLGASLKADTKQSRLMSKHPTWLNLLSAPRRSGRAVIISQQNYFQGHSFCSLLLIKSLFDRGLFVTKFKCFKLLSNI